MKRYRTIPELLPAVVAAAELGITSSTIRHHARANQIGYYRIETGKQMMYLFTREDLRRFRKGVPPVAQSKR